MADWGRKIGSALYLDCDTPPSVGHVPVIVSPGVARTGQLQSNSIADDAILGQHLAGLDALLFGGSFGNAGIVADGTTTIAALGAAPVSNVYTLTKDVSCKRLTVNTGVTIITGGYKILGQYLLLKGTAIIHCDGTGNTPTTTTGADSVGQTGGTAPLGRAAGTLGAHIGGNGTKGGDGGAVGAVGAAGIAATAGANSLGGSGGSGAIGGTSTTLVAGGAAGAGATATATAAAVDYFRNAQDLLDSTAVPPILIKGGANGGSGGGGGGNAATAGGGGGGGGTGGGVVMLSFGTVEFEVGWTGRISAIGGGGGSGFITAASAGAQGGGGGGGAVVLVCRRILGSYTSVATNAIGFTSMSAAVCVNGGLPGQAGAVASVGGNAGTVVVLSMSQPNLYDITGDAELMLPPISNARTRKIKMNATTKHSPY